MVTAIVVSTNLEINDSGTKSCKLSADEKRHSVIVFDAMQFIMKELL